MYKTQKTKRSPSGEWSCPRTQMPRFDLRPQSSTFTLPVQANPSLACETPQTRSRRARQGRIRCIEGGRNGLEDVQLRTAVFPSSLPHCRSQNRSSSPRTHCGLIRGTSICHLRAFGPFPRLRSVHRVDGSPATSWLAPRPSTPSRRRHLTQGTSIHHDNAKTHELALNPHHTDGPQLTNTTHDYDVGRGTITRRLATFPAFSALVHTQTSVYSSPTTARIHPEHKRSVRLTCAAETPNIVS